MSKPKQPVKSKEQILAEMERAKNTARKREKIRNEVFPLLANSTENIGDARLFTQSVVVAIQQAFTNQMQTQKVGEFKLEENVNVKADHASRYIDIFNILKEETLRDALDMIEGLVPAIEGLEKNKSNLKPISDYNVDDILGKDDPNAPKPKN